MSNPTWTPPINGASAAHGDLLSSVGIDGFWRNVNREGPIQPHAASIGCCWEWLGSHLPTGYGTISILSHDWYTHRLSWVLCNGLIPDDMMVCHRCDNTRCVNPHHLFLGTALDNARDMAAKGRGRKPRSSLVVNRRRKLQPSDVIEMRAAYGAGVSVAKLAAKYGIGFDAARNIVTRKTWQNI